MDGKNKENQTMALISFLFWKLLVKILYISLRISGFSGSLVMEKQHFL